jgi:SNF2 family DNA or RNA helicase
MQVGLNMQGANHMIRCGPSWKSTTVKQVEGRIYRPGQKKPVWNIEIVAANGPVDQHRLQALKRKHETVDHVMQLGLLRDGTEIPAELLDDGLLRLKSD